MHALYHCPANKVALINLKKKVISMLSLLNGMERPTWPIVLDEPDGRIAKEELIEYISRALPIAYEAYMHKNDGPKYFVKAVKVSNLVTNTFRGI